MLRLDQLQQLALQTEADCITAFNRVGIFDPKTEAALLGLATANYNASKQFHDSVEVALTTAMKAAVPVVTK